MESKNSNPKEKRPIGKRFAEVEWIHIIFGLVLGVLAPIIINWMIGRTLPDWSILPKVVGTDEDWLGFYGNYAGSFIGITYAVVVALRTAKKSRIELQEQIIAESLRREAEEKKEKERLAVQKRLFTDFSWIETEITLDKSVDRPYAKIIITEAYDYWLNAKFRDHLNIVKFGRFRFIGDSKLAYDLHFRIYYKQNEKELCINKHIGELSVEDILFIPIISKEGPRKRNGKVVYHSELDIIRTEVEYKTLGSEHLLFIADYVSKEVSFTRIEPDGINNDIYRHPANNVTWLVPASEFSPPSDED